MIKEVVIEKEVIKEVPVEKIVHVEVLVTKEVPVTVEVIREVLVPVEKIVERLVEKEVETREKTTMNKPQVVKITEQVVRMSQRALSIVNTSSTENTFKCNAMSHPPGVSSVSHLLSPSLLADFELICLNLL